jgi:hypothetical protein
MDVDTYRDEVWEAEMRWNWKGTARQQAQVLKCVIRGGLGETESRIAPIEPSKGAVCAVSEVLLPDK